LVTIRQVARRAGVSIGTVSRVLNNKPGVSEKTRQYVLTVAQELRYSLPKYLAPSFTKVTQLSLLVRPLKDGLMSNPFYADVFHGLEKVCREQHINLSFSSLDIVEERLRSLPPLVKDRYNNGIVLLGALPEEVVDSVIAFFQLPVVLVDNCFAHRAIDTIMADNIVGMHLAVELLRAKGHVQIGFIGGPGHPSIVERRKGYEAALRQHNLRPMVIPRSGLEPEDGERGVVELLQKAPETTAILCSNDLQAIGALRKLQQLGFAVPADFSLIGFDDINLVQFTSPPLTTIHVDRETLGQMAAQLLLEKIENPAHSTIKMRVGVRLVERGSVCAPRSRTDFEMIPT
jgi:LacI family transcriptional regulator